MDPFEGLTPEQRERARAIADRFEAAMRDWSEHAPLLGSAQSIAGMKDAIREQMGRVLRECVADCGFDVEEQEHAASSVQVLEADDDGAFTVSYETNERVSAYLDAIQRDDIERAIMVRAAREG